MLVPDVWQIVLLYAYAMLKHGKDGAYKDGDPFCVGMCARARAPARECVHVLGIHFSCLCYSKIH